MRQRAFTLIELLIVVAIIAILAAIAVPNFLEAQTRAKVSRTKSDMRSVATGLESYRIDNNDYPPDFSAGINTFMGRLKFITTPVAYLTALPEDVFGEAVANGSAGALTSSPYREGGTTTGEIINPVVFDYASFDDADAMLPDGDGNGFPDVWDRISSSQAVQWALSSPGPNTQTVQFLGSADYTIYDPTNGTISEGQILRTSNSGEEVPRSIQ